MSYCLRLLRKRLGQKLIVVSPENVTIYPDGYSRIPDAATGHGYVNYFIPIINASIDDIDLVTSDATRCTDYCSYDKIGCKLNVSATRANEYNHSSTTTSTSTVRTSATCNSS